MSLRLVHVELAEANAFVDALHRHHKRVVGHKFSLGALDTNQEGHFADGKLVGVAIVGRPVARRLDDGETLEVTRLCTDGTANACSFLYGACRRATFALGFSRIGTYTLQDEGGASLRAAGWTLLGERGGGSWVRESDPLRKSGDSGTKLRWEAKP